MEYSWGIRLLILAVIAICFVPELVECAVRRYNFNVSKISMVKLFSSARKYAAWLAC